MVNHGYVSLPEGNSTCTGSIGSQTIVVWIKNVIGVPEHFLRWGANKKKVKFDEKNNEFLWVYPWYGMYRYMGVSENRLNP